MPKIIVLATLMAHGVTTMASTQDSAPSIEVGYSDLDLTTDAGRKTLDRRLKRAVSLVCGPNDGNRDLSRLIAVRKCRAKAMEQIAVPRAQALAAAARRTLAAAQR